MEFGLLIGIIIGFITGLGAALFVLKVIFGVMTSELEKD